MSGFAPEQDRAAVRPSPNFGARLGVERPDMIVLHYTGMASGQAAEDRLCDPVAEVSSHYIVHEDGRVVQMVREADRAWHAGKSFWRGHSDINSRSVGIEIVNPGHEFGYADFPEAQMAAVIALCLGVQRRHGIAPDLVLAHSDVAPGRKVDPGEKFDWALLARHGLGHYVTPHPVVAGPVLAKGDEGKEVALLQEMLADYGYGLAITGQFDEATEKVVDAFQRHFRPALVDRRADLSTLRTLAALVESRRAATMI